MWEHEPGLYSPPPNAFYSHVLVPTARQHTRAVRKLLCHRGRFLKHVTQQTRVDYIWYSKDARIVEIWAYDERCLRNAHRWIRRAVERLAPDRAGLAVLESDLLEVLPDAELEHAVLNDRHEQDQNDQNDDQQVHDGSRDEGHVGQDDDDHADGGDHDAPD